MRSRARTRTSPSSSSTCSESSCLRTSASSPSPISEATSDGVSTTESAPQPLSESILAFALTPAPWRPAGPPSVGRRPARRRLEPTHHRAAFATTGRGRASRAPAPPTTTRQPSSPERCRQAAHHAASSRREPRLVAWAPRREHALVEHQLLHRGTTRGCEPPASSSSPPGGRRWPSRTRPRVTWGWNGAPSGGKPIASAAALEPVLQQLQRRRRRHADPEHARPAQTREGAQLIQTQARAGRCPARRTGALPRSRRGGRARPRRRT